jgi:hypothetical protein
MQSLLINNIQTPQEEVNSNLPFGIQYIYINELSKFIESKALSAEELRLVLYIRTKDTKCEGIPISWRLLAKEFKKSRTTFLGIKDSLIERSILEEVGQGEGRASLYKLLPIEGWQERVVVKREKPVTKDNVINFPVPEEPSIWRSPEDSDSNRYWQTGPIYDDVSGQEVERQCKEEGLIPQQVVKRAIAFSKVPQLLLGAIALIGEKLVAFIDKLGEEVRKVEETKPKKVIPAPSRKASHNQGAGGVVQKLDRSESVNPYGGEIEKWYTQKYQEGYFREPWECFLKERRNGSTLVWKYSDHGQKGVKHESGYIRVLYEKWDDEIINWLQGASIYEGHSKREDYTSPTQSGIFPD